MQSTNSDSTPEISGRKSTRLHYLDSLHVLAILIVFLYHSSLPFNLGEWHIKNAERSTALTIALMPLSTWGMPFFFLMSGITSWYALRRRTTSQFAIERVKRLLIPFIIGSLVLTPIQFYYEWTHRVQTGLFQGSLLEFFRARAVGFSPRVFALYGFHLYFIGFLFAFSLIALPLFTWFKREAGQRFTGWLAGVGERRGGILLFVIPLTLVQVTLQPFYPADLDWAQFVYYLLFFISGHVLYSDERFARVIRRDGLLLLAAAILSTLLLLAGLLYLPLTHWMGNPGVLWYYVGWGLYALNSWCWSASLLYIGMRFLDFSSKWLRYSQTASMPFFLLHQPVIIVTAFYVVQWEAGILVKLPVVVASSFLVTLGLYELLRRIGAVRVLMGMKPRTKAQK